MRSTKGSYELFQDYCMINLSYLQVTICADNEHLVNIETLAEQSTCMVDNWFNHNLVKWMLCRVV